MKDTAVFIVHLWAGNCALETKEAKASAAGRTKQPRLFALTFQNTLQNHTVDTLNILKQGTGTYPDQSLSCIIFTFEPKS